jgi:uncharacterized membrane protein
MFFAYMAQRPAAGELEPPARLTLWVATFKRFFPWVWGSIIILPVSGYWMIAKMGGFGAVGLYVHIMQAVGIIMILIFLHVFFAPYQRLKKLVGEAQFPEAGKQLARIRRLIGINLTLGLGLTTLVIALKYWG